MAPKHTTGGPRAHYPGINKVAPAHAIGGSHRSEYSHQPAYEGNAEKDADYFPHEVTSVSTVFRTIAEVVVEEKL